MLLFLYLLSQLKPTKFNLRIIALSNVPLGIGFGMMVSELEFALLGLGGRSNIYIFILISFFILYLFLYYRILIEIFKF